jgi:hypothetical protein
MFADLHAHSTASDGSLTPEELIDYAISKGIGVCALCDHDTTAGIRRFLSYASGKPLRAIPGVELSATWESGNCHITGLGVTDDYAPLESMLHQIRQSRDSRNERIIHKLNELGVAITLDDVGAIAGGEVVARPHIARIMHEKGYVGSVKEAFTRYLAKGAPAYVDRYRLDPGDAVALLAQAGALPVLAHPSQLLLTPEGIDSLVHTLKLRGLAGIEIYTPYTSEEQIPVYRAIARKHGLLVCGGSDFHGVSKPDHYLGYYRKDMPIPRECAEYFTELLHQR